MTARLVFIVCLAAATASADAPATQPATYSICGQAAVDTGLDFATPDLTRVVAYLESDPALDNVPPGKATVAQHNKAFVPNFIVIPKGTVVEFPNQDHIYHNVFSRSAAAPAFDLDRYPYGQSKIRTFEKVGVVQLFCNIHPFMKALIVVTPNSYFARADAGGKFEIKNVPAGHYELVIWQERCGPQRRAVDVGPEAAPPINVTLHEDRGSILANDPPEEEGYGVSRGLDVKREKLNLPVVEDSHPAPSTEASDDAN